MYYSDKLICRTVLKRTLIKFIQTLHLVPAQTPPEYLRILHNALLPDALWDRRVALHTVNRATGTERRTRTFWSDHRSKICAGVRLFLEARSTIVEWLNRMLRTSGAQAWRSSASVPEDVQASANYLECDTVLTAVRHDILMRHERVQVDLPA